MSGERGPVVLFLSQDKEAGGVKVIIGLNKLKEEIKTF